MVCLQCPIIEIKVQNYKRTIILHRKFAYITLCKFFNYSEHIRIFLADPDYRYSSPKGRLTRNVSKQEKKVAKFSENKFQEFCSPIDVHCIQIHNATQLCCYLYLPYFYVTHPPGPCSARRRGSSTLWNWGTVDLAFTTLSGIPFVHRSG